MTGLMQLAEYREWRHTWEYLEEGKEYEKCLQIKIRLKN